VLTILAVVGTRPEVIKMAPVIDALRRCPERARVVVCATGQHRELVGQAMAVFGLCADVHLDIMEPDQALCTLTARLFERLGGVVRDLRPDWVVAEGDTTSVMVAAMTAFYERRRFGHVEAGLRTGSLALPFPEEVNRVIADRVSDLLFAPTDRARRNLLAEGLPEAAIRLTGNTVVDALQTIAQRDYDWSTGPLARVPRDRRLVLVTAHRRESFGRDLDQQARAIRRLADRYAHDVHIVWPVHPNPNVTGPVRELLRGAVNVTLLDPLDYQSLVHLMRRCTVILTDSGGIQEEAPTFGVPVLVMRDTTERPEGVDAGVARLIGADGDRIVEEAARVLEDGSGWPGRRVNPYGDGHAGQRIADALLTE
jgi:UDP-N-acetylglucosamine 2-epimerase (non-hydrolysing)